MRKVILPQLATIDNLAAGPDGESRSDIDKDSLDIMDSIDWILLGRVTYPMFADFLLEATTETDPLNATTDIV